MIRNRIPETICAALFTLAAGGLSAQDVSLGGRLGGVAGVGWFEDDDSNGVVKPLCGLQIRGQEPGGSNEHSEWYGSWGRINRMRQVEKEPLGTPRWL